MDLTPDALGSDPFFSCWEAYKAYFVDWVVLHFSREAAKTQSFGHQPLSFLASWRESPFPFQRHDQRNDLGNPAPERSNDSV